MKRSKLNIVNIISWLQIIGGITGLGLIAYLLLQTDIVNGPTLLIFLIGISLFLFSIYAGNALFFSPDKKRGLVLIIVNQLFQWSIFCWGISYSSGAELLIGMKGLAVTFKAGAVISTFSMSVHSHDDFFISVNLVSILVIILSIRSYKKIEAVEIKS